MNYIIFDLECTCWRGSPPLNKQEIIEIGAVLLNDYGEVEDLFSHFVRPVINPLLSPFCLELTNITQTQINRAKTFPTVIEDFKDWCDIGNEEYILMSWGDFDRKMLVADCRLHQLESSWALQHVSLKEQYQRMKKMKQQPGLFKTVEREGFEFEGSQHRAINDAKNLAKVFRKYLDSWQF